jgi:hypothetical protein
MSLLSNLILTIVVRARDLVTYKQALEAFTGCG